MSAFLIPEQALPVRSSQSIIQNAMLTIQVDGHDYPTVGIEDDVKVTDKIFSVGPYSGQVGLGQEKHVGVEPSQELQKTGMLRP